jgi:hypothetical protein
MKQAQAKEPELRYEACRYPLSIDIKQIPQDRMRYNTSGDWQFDQAGGLHIRVSVEKDDGEHQAFLYALHEMVEAYLCKAKGITTQQVDDFDMDRSEYCAENDLEPGDMKESPYRLQHRQAMLIEHLMANFLGLVDYGSVL